jgi:hypothetical protein
MPINRLSPPEKRPTFRAQVRHYHRSGGQSLSWQQWVDPSSNPRKTRRKIIRLALLFAVLAGVAALVAFLVTRGQA